MASPLTEAIIHGNNEVLLPTLLSTLSICIVFVPIFLLSGVAKYLFSPLAFAVVAVDAGQLVCRCTICRAGDASTILLQGRMKHGDEQEAEQEVRRILQRRSSRSITTSSAGFHRLRRSLSQRRRVGGRLLPGSRPAFSAC